jgi:signal transduction histidine kinase
MKIKYFFLILFFGVTFSIVSQENKNFHETLLNESAIYFIKFNQKNSLQETEKLSFVEFNKIKELPIQTKAVWLELNLKNLKSDSLFIFSKESIAKIELYKLINNKFRLITQSGYANRINNNSDKENCRVLKFYFNSNDKLYLKIKSNRYKVKVPDLFINNTFNVNESKSTLNVITLLGSVFQVAFLVLSFILIMLRYDQRVYNYMIFFVLACVSDLLFYFSSSNILILESSFFPQITNSMVWNVIGDLNIIFYYLFFIAFFNVKKKSFTYYFTRIGILFWIFQIFIELTDFYSIFLIKFSKYYLHCAAIIDFLVLGLLTFYIIKNRFKNIDQKIAFIGIVVFTISSFEIAMPRIVGLLESKIEWLNYSFSNIVILQFATLTNVLSFVTAILYRYVNYEKENYTIKNELLQKEIERHQSVENERSRIAADMHDDLGSGLTRITYLSQLAKGKLTDENLAKIKQTSIDLVENMSEIIWAMKEDNNTLEDLITYIKMFSADYLESNNIQLFISIPESYNSIVVIGDYRRNVFLSVKETLHNIVKHSKATNVNITISNQNNLLISIKDNGIGFENKKSNSKTGGNGLNNIKNRIEKIGGQIEMIDKNGIETIFTIPIENLNQ